MPLAIALKITLTDDQPQHLQKTVRKWTPLSVRYSRSVEGVRCFEAAGQALGSGEKGLAH